MFASNPLVYAAGKPRIEIVGGEVIDLGRGMPGRYTREIAIANIGQDTLRLLAISSGCGCLVGEPSRSAIAPGDTARVQVVVETTGQVVEKWQKVLTIASNDPARPTVDVTVRVSFHHDLRLRSYINTVRREQCASDCTWIIELENISDTILVVNPPFVEEMRGLSVAFDLKQPRALSPGEVLMITGNITILGEEEIPSAKAMIATSSEFDRETYVSYFYLPETQH
ncbi:MAG: DUF1573 domain-containing protein [bacterium]|nr:DUF1573 domain-containing protein [Candidatus Kapabacteria bacterium]